MIFYLIRTNVCNTRDGTRLLVYNISMSESVPRSPFFEQAERLRTDVFEFPSWREGQAEILAALGQGENVLGVLPTGRGKSLCYQIPAMMGGAGIVLVVSPLIALMKDQVDAARANGVRAAAIHSGLSRDEKEQVLRDVAKRSVTLLYATPERFRSEPFLEAIRASGGVRLLAVDEAHCISTWGHDFRLDYSRLGDRRRELGSPQTVALTATATVETRADIVRQLGLNREILADPWRGNLGIEVLETMGMDEKLRAFVMLRHQRPGPAIVYFSLVQTLRKFSEEIERFGMKHVVYHGQLQDRVRRRNQEAFIGGAEELMLATPAFGLGVDKPDVRLLVHAEIPGALEGYYQEIGRAGRDGERSECALLYDRDDVSIQTDFLKWGTPDPGFIQSVHNLIARNEMRARQEGFEYLRAQMNFYNRRDFRVETAVQLLERWGALEGREPREWRVVGEIPLEYLDQKAFQENLKRRELKLQQIVNMAESDSGCRLQQVSSVFGKMEASRRCGICDLCAKEVGR